MKRTNTFLLAPTEKQHRRLLEIADTCARLWNELNYRRRQSFFKGKINWGSRDLYDKYKGIIGSASLFSGLGKLRRNMASQSNS